MHYKDYIVNTPAYKPAKLIGQKVSDMVKLSSNENPLGPSPMALEAMQQAMPNMYRYPDSSAQALRQALADHVELTPDHVICGNGADDIIGFICLAFLREGDEAVMAYGSFISYLLRTLVMGGTPVRVPLNNYTHDLQAMAKAITPRTKALFICNPNNPTGTTNGADEMRELLEQVPEDVLIVVDEAYIEFAARPDFPDMLAELRNGRNNLMIIRTFAKIYGLAGLRLGYAYTHPDITAYLHRARNIYNVNAMAQAAGVAALQDTDHIARSRAHIEASRLFFTRELTALRLAPIPSETNFIAVDVDDDMAVTDGLFHHGFTVSPLAGWGLPGHIRISFGTTEQNEQFITAFATVLGKD